MDKFFVKANPKKILASDYENYGKLLSKVGKDTLAIVNVKKATMLDSTKSETFNTLAELYTKNKQYKEAAATYASKIKNGKKISNVDYYKYGTALYYANDYNKADTAFIKVLEIDPAFVGGYLWRAKCNAQLDPESTKGLSKPYYEKFIELAAANPAKVSSTSR